MTTFELNGKEVTVQGDHPHLLAALRDELGILSAKDGCSPSGQCGCCTVIMDGKARISCQLSAERANGSTIQTLEGLDTEEIDKMGQAFAACGALQCGFCTPGMVMSAIDLLQNNKKPSDKEIRDWLEGNICRCTGYQNIVAAVKEASTKM